MGDAFLLAGQREIATLIAHQALALARERGQRGGEASALAVLGEIGSSTEPVDVEAGEGHCRQAIAIATELGMRPLVAYSYLGLGSLYRRAGKLPPARECLAAAVALFREMDMRLWRDKAEGELAAST